MPTKPGMCDEATFNHNVTEAKKLKKWYYRVGWVTVEGSTGDRVSISVPTTDGGRRTLENLEWGNTDTMWVYCPATLRSEAIHPRPGKAPERNANGTLYLEERFVKEHEILALEPTPKWPPRLPGERLAPLSVRPISLILKGQVLAADGTNEPIEIDLMNPELAPEQSLVLGGSAVALTLSARPEPVAVLVMPMSLILRGQELADDGADRTVNLHLMNPRHVPEQVITVRRDVITVQLTRTGFASVSIRFPRRPRLEEAVAIIKARRSPSEMAEAYEIVDFSLELALAGQWPETDQKSGKKDLTTSEALQLIRQVVDLP